MILAYMHRNGYLRASGQNSNTTIQFGDLSYLTRMNISLTNMHVIVFGHVQKWQYFYFRSEILNLLFQRYQFHVVGLKMLLSVVTVYSD